MKKTSAIFGEPEPYFLQQPIHRSPEFLKAYEDYIKQKAYESKTPWLASLLPPAILGLGIGFLLNRKNPKPIIPLLAAATGAGAGTLVKELDDDAIEMSRRHIQLKSDEELHKALQRQMLEVQDRPEPLQAILNVVKRLNKTAGHKSKSNIVSNITDYGALSAIGGAAGLVGTAVQKTVSGNKVYEPFYNPHLSELAKKDYYAAILSKNKFFRSMLKGGLGGALALPAAYGIYKTLSRSKNKPPLSTPIKLLGAGAAVGLGKFLHGHRGKLYLIGKGLENTFDLWRGGRGTRQFFTSEKWIKNKAYEDIKNPINVNNENVQQFLHNETISKTLKDTQIPDASLKGKKSLETVSDALAQTTGTKFFGGDPEFNLVLTSRRKKLPLTISTFPRDQSKLKNVTSDFTTMGGELLLEPGNIANLKRNVELFTSQLKENLPKRVKLEELSVIPVSPSKNYRTFSRKTAGGHIHLEFDIPKGETEQAYREKVLKRISTLISPIDATHPAGRVRAGLESSRGTYGKKILDNRSLQRASWTPKEGFLDAKGNVIRSNAELRAGPSYIGDETALEKKLRLINIALYHPKAKKLDVVADNIFKATGNESKYLYNKNLKKYHVNAIKKFLNEDIDVHDKWVEDVLHTHLKGGVRQIGK